MSTTETNPQTVAAALVLATSEAWQQTHPDEVVTFEVMPVDPIDMPGYMVRMLDTTDAVVRAYRCGDTIRRQRWAVCVRVDATSDAQRAEAVAEVDDLAEAARDAVPSLPSGFEFHTTSSTRMPSLTAANDVYDTWQVTLETTYMRRRLR